MNVIHKMMSLKSLVFLLVLTTQTTKATYLVEEEEDALDKLARMVSQEDLESVKELLTDAIVDEIQTEIFNGASLSESEDERETVTTTTESRKPGKSRSESRMEGSWLDMDSGPSSVFDDPDENDALFSSRDGPNPRKRDDYYESLEKKSQRSTYVPPPRKNFYSNNRPEEEHFLDSSSSEERYHEERPDYERPPTPRMMERPEDQHHHHHHHHHHPESDSLTDVIHAASHPLLESLHLLPSHGMYQQSAMQVPPWRFSQGRAYPRKQTPPPPPPAAAPPMSEEQHRPPPPPPPPQQQQQPSSDPMIGKAAVHHKRRGSYRKTTPRRPVPPPVPVHMTKIHQGRDDFKFKTKPRSKPTSSWTSDYKSKEPIAPKLRSPQDDNSFMAPPSMGRPIRQQFHEQGTRGPHSYKFGYSTGDIDNPMARYEERDADGIVRGSYSYVDPRGQKQVIHYESHPKFGFKTRTSPTF